MSEPRGTMTGVSITVSGQKARVARLMTTAELLAGGWSERRIRTLAKRGDLIAIGRGVYADGDKARKLLSLSGGDQLLAVAAAVAVVGRGAVLSHQSAAYLHKVDVLGRPDSHDTTVALTCPAHRGRRGRNGIQIHTASLSADQVTEVIGLPVTTAARTVVDLARTLEFRAGVVAADSALHQRLVTKADLLAQIAGCPRWRGARRAAEVVEFADGLAESPLESIARVVFRDRGLPAPQLQAWFGAGFDDSVRVDFYWPKYRTVAEVDGALKYSDPMRARAQLRRDSWLRGQGLEVVHFDWQEIIGAPDAVAAAIRTAFRRGVLLAAPPRATG